MLIKNTFRLQFAIEVTFIPYIFYNNIPMLGPAIIIKAGVKISSPIGEILTSYLLNAKILAV